jgi:hypothetical protein
MPWSIALPVLIALVALRAPESAWFVIRLAALLWHRQDASHANDAISFREQTAKSHEK